MRLRGSLRIGFLRRAVALSAAALLSACGTLNVVSEGGDSNLMLRGHDPVAYFSAGRATPGRPDLKVGHRGVTYRFASDENRRQFLTSPERYVPQFGGFCANGMVYAIPIPSESDVFKIVDGKLYVFDSARAKLYFEMDQERNLRLANHYWESEAREASWRLQAWKRLLWRVPHYKSDSELAAEYQKRFGRRPG